MVRHDSNSSAPRLQRRQWLHHRITASQHNSRAHTAQRRIIINRTRNFNSNFSISGFERSSLSLKRFQPRTINAYRRALYNFCAWVKSSRVAYNAIGTPSVGRIDAWLSLYFQWLQRHGGSFSAASLTVSAVAAFRPSARRNLPLAKSELSGWRAITISKQHPPLSWPLACAIAHQLALTGYSRAAVGALLSFDCLLRVSELTRLKPSDIIEGDEADPRIEPFVTVRLRRTKTGINQSVRIFEPEVSRLIVQLKRFTPQSETLLAGMGANNFRRRFKTACAELGLSSQYVPHSLRHGGATRLWIMGKEASTIKVRGRWKSLDSCERYLQVAESVIGILCAPQSTIATARTIARGIVKSIANASARYAATHATTATAAAGT